MLFRSRIRQAARSRIFAEPGRLVRDRAAAVDQQGARLHRLVHAAVDRGRERLAATTARLEAGSPLKLLARGWSVTWADRDGAEPSALKTVADVAPGAVLVTQLTDGKIWSRVERTAEDACQT